MACCPAQPKTFQIPTLAAPISAPAQPKTFQTPLPPPCTILHQAHQPKTVIQRKAVNGLCASERSEIPGAHTLYPRSGRAAQPVRQRDSAWNDAGGFAEFTSANMRPAKEWLQSLAQWSSAARRGLAGGISYTHGVGWRRSQSASAAALGTTLAGNRGFAPVACVPPRSGYSRRGACGGRSHPEVP